MLYYSTLEFRCNVLGGSESIRVGIKALALPAYYSLIHCSLTAITGVLKYNIKEWSKWIPKSLLNQTLYNSIKTWAEDMAVKVEWSPANPDLNVVLQSGIYIDNVVYRNMLKKDKGKNWFHEF